MTSGERMVWAAAFDRAVAAGSCGLDASIAATRRVQELRAVVKVAPTWPDIDVDVLAALEDMTGAKR